MGRCPGFGVGGKVNKKDDIVVQPRDWHHLIVNKRD